MITSTLEFSPVLQVLFARRVEERGVEVAGLTRATHFQLLCAVHVGRQ